MRYIRIIPVLSEAKQRESEMEGFGHQARLSVSGTPRISGPLSHESVPRLRSKTATGCEHSGTWKCVVGNRGPQHRDRSQLLPPLTARWEHGFRPIGTDSISDTKNMNSETQFNARIHSVWHFCRTGYPPSVRLIRIRIINYRRRRATPDCL